MGLPPRRGEEALVLTVKTSSRDGRRAGRQPCLLPATTGISPVAAKKEDDVTDTSAGDGGGGPGAILPLDPGRAMDVAVRPLRLGGCRSHGTGDAAYCARLSGPGTGTDHGPGSDPAGFFLSSARFRRVGTGCGRTSRSFVQGPRFLIADGTQVTLRSLSEPSEFARIAAPVIEKALIRR
jgi:hypothetical protein